jgi:hypothetical protein
MIGVTFVEFGLPTLQPGVQKHKWVHNRRKFLESLSFQQCNIVLTGGLYLELDPCTNMLVYSYPKQIHNYPAIAQAFPHIVQQPQSLASSSGAGQISTFQLLQISARNLFNIELPQEHFNYTL